MIIDMEYFRKARPEIVNVSEEVGPDGKEYFRVTCRQPDSTPENPKTDHLHLSPEELCKALSKGLIRTKYNDTTHTAIRRFLAGEKPGHSTLTGEKIVVHGYGKLDKYGSWEFQLPMDFVNNTGYQPTGTKRGKN